MLLRCFVKGAEKTHCKGVVQAVKAVCTIVHDIETVDIMKSLQRLNAVVLTHVSIDLMIESDQICLVRSDPISSHLIWKARQIFGWTFPSLLLKCLVLIYIYCLLRIVRHLFKLRHGFSLRYCVRIFVSSVSLLVELLDHWTRRYVSCLTGKPTRCSSGMRALSRTRTLKTSVYAL